jgi:hypothetical protein
MKKIIWILLILAAVSVPIGAILLAQNYFPDECQNCPYCGNLGRQIRSFYDPTTNQYLWEYTCYQNHIWNCPADPPPSK